MSRKCPQSAWNGKLDDIRIWNVVSTTGANWNGKLDDIRIWNVVRTANQISTSFQTELSSSLTGLVANYKLDDATGSTANDVGVTRSYTYDGDGLLKSRTEAGATTQLLWDAASVPAQLLVSSTDRIVHGLGPLYIVRGDNTTKTLATDGLGSVRAEVNDAGAVSASFRYAVYGRPVTKPALPTLIGYAGQLGDSSGLIYLRARWYDPTAARFVASDAFRGSLTRPSSLNGYGYAAGRPILLTDPMGLNPTTDEQASESKALFIFAADPTHVRHLGTHIFFLVAFGPAILLAEGDTGSPDASGPEAEEPTEPGEHEDTPPNAGQRVKATEREIKQIEAEYGNVPIEKIKRILGEPNGDISSRTRRLPSPSKRWAWSG